MKNKIFYGLGILVALIIGIIIGNGISESNGSKTKSKSPTPSSLVKGKADTSTSDSEEEQDAENFTDIIKTYYGTQPSIENFYVTGTIDVNRDGDVKPGIYNLVINQGGGNISNSSGSRVDYKNWIGYPAMPIFQRLHRQQALGAVLHVGKLKPMRLCQRRQMLRHRRVQAA